ncbi:hypothetical protein ACFU44_26375 [Nocardia rhizosphaerihabitans]|uniref:hypothetical protein n=1 Tax=Nocardia rhizosphaerihabitans TaxID=1691570 RepID=UPI00366F1C90
MIAAVAISLGCGVSGAAIASAASAVAPEPVATDLGSATPYTASADPDSGSALPGLLLRCLTTGSGLSMGMPVCA